jgi:hypothetical protein
MLLRRPCTRGLLLAVFLTALPMGSAHATGVPTMDIRNMVMSMGHAVQKGADWYMQARDARNAGMLKARTMIARTRQAVSLRERYERQAVGNLGKLGGWVPDWREYGNFCAVEAGGYSVCNFNNIIMRRFEREVGNLQFRFEGAVFDRRMSVDETIRDFIGGQFAAGASALDSLNGGRRESNAQSYRFMVSQAQRADALDEVAEEINRMLDEMSEEEIEGQAISSGRAKQITALLTFAEAMAEVELTRSRLGALELNAVAAADQVLEERRAVHTRNTVARW